MKMITFPITGKSLRYYDIERHNLRIIEEKIEDGYEYNTDCYNEFDTDFQDYLFFQERIWRTKERISESRFLEIIEEFHEYNSLRIVREDYYNRASK